MNKDINYTYVYRNINGDLVKTSSRAAANNAALYSGSAVIIQEDGKAIDSFKPIQIDQSNLICGGFHNPTIRTNSFTNQSDKS